MFDYEACKKAALSFCESIHAEVNRAFDFGKAFVFENADINYVGYIPCVVKKDDLSICGLWDYLTKENLSMDDMKDIPF